MTFGVSALDCRLDSGVDWTDLVTWAAGVRPAFAGKYFIASPWRWVHGEGTALVDPVVPGGSLAVAPIQSGDPVRQAEPDDLGQQWGDEDGTALADAVSSALEVGDLAFGSAGTPIYVYLEVDADTALSSEYWAGWAGAVSTALLVGSQAGSELPLVQGLLPCLATTFAAAEAGPFEASQTIRDALDGSAGIGWASARCYGFWATTADPATIQPAPVLDWSGFAAYSQKQRSGPDVPVPVTIWRYATGDPSAPVHQVGKITLEATQATSGQPDPLLGAMLNARAWSAGARPSTIGVDRGASLSREIGCLSSKKLTVSFLPEIDLSGNKGPALVPPLTVPASFAARYYSAGPQADGSPPPSNAKDLTRAEAGVMSKAGVDIASCFQTRQVQYPGVPAYLATPGNGHADGQAAGWFAASQARQPPYTPIYFAVDCDVTTSGESTVEPGAISDAELIDYFTGVQQGLTDYLAAQPKELRVPYAVGVYSCAHAFNLLYPLGLASHYWQAFPAFWGDSVTGDHSNRPAWPRANVWQVNMDYVLSAQQDSGVLACRVVFVWVLLVNHQQGPAQIQVTAGTQVTTLTFPPTDTALAAATGASVTITSPQAGVTRFQMTFTAEPVGLNVVQLGGASAGFQMRLIELGLADVNVSWGDTGGWRAPRGGA
jgi:hypothetical protein